MRSQARQMFSPEFKREAVRLLGRGDKEVTTTGADLLLRENKSNAKEGACDSFELFAPLCITTITKSRSITITLSSPEDSCCAESVFKVHRC